MKQLIKKILIRILGPVLRAVLRDEFAAIHHKTDDMYTILLDLQKNIVIKAYNYDKFEQYMHTLQDIRIEATNYCQYHCKMCPHDHMTRKRGFQSIDDFQWILKNITAYNPNFNGIFQLHNFGEALLDKTLVEKIGLVRQALPNAYIRFLSTVGVESGIFEDMVIKGLNLLMISCYGIDRQTYKNIHGVDRYDLITSNMIELSRLVTQYKDKFSVLIAGPFIDGKGILPDIEKDKIEKFKQRMLSYGFQYNDSNLHNYGGKMNINSFIRPVKPCSIYKGEMSHVLDINWDMKVVPCCMVTDQEIVFGDLHEKNLREIYYDTAWTNFREAHKKMTLKSDLPFCWKCHQDSNIWMRDNS
jgi:MoaA/NifB/PqqE/SkfB family radical SAM enzyme